MGKFKWWAKNVQPTIKLANAFSKAWGIALPLFIDDTQIYQEDELDATMQLIRITEVPNALLEVK